jgi:hypothetical protein
VARCEVEECPLALFTLEALDIRLALALARHIVALFAVDGAQLIAMAELAAFRPKVVIGRHAHVTTGK